jgi:hypothetical protein
VAHYYVTLGGVKPPLSIYMFFIFIFYPDQKLLPVFFNFKKERKKERKIVLAFLKVACP